MNPHWERLQHLFDAASELDPAERGAFLDSECGGDPELRREVESLLGDADQAGDRIQGIIQNGAGLLVRNDPPVRQIGPYRILEAVGEGGMGAVYRAVRDDGQYQKQVAIKVVRTALSIDDLFIRRFIEERQILAQLEHANIARLIDGGVTPEGLPYLVMEFVEGQPLDAWRATHDPSLRERLQLFRQVCDAVQYAHRNLVVHRDLKPGNVLVTERGVAKLLDFGVAKVLHAGHDLTQTGVTLMTLDYASPEQVRGGPITTASDIYSLGLLLYELLAGKRARILTERSPSEIVRVICDQDPPPPSAAGSRRDLSGDLDNIVMKALSKEPSRRYSSAEQMSDDIGRYLDGQPVIARKSTFTYRASKFVRRNRAACVSATLAVLALVGGTVFTAREAVIAGRRFEDVRKLANSVVYEFDKALENVPGATAARRLLVDRASSYLNNLARDAEGNRELQKELAAAYEKVGDVQGNPSSKNLGDTRGALESLRKAAAIREELARATPGDADNIRSLSSDYRQIGYLLIEIGDAAGGMEMYRKALARDVPDPGPEDARRISALYQRMGELAGTHGTLGSAVEQYRKAVQVLEDAAGRFPKEDFRKERATANSGLGRAYKEAGDLKNALEYTTRAFEFRKAMAQREPANIEYRRSVWFSQIMMGDILGNPNMFNLGDNAKCLENYRSALALAEQAAADDPKNYRAQRDLMVNLNRLGDAQHATGDVPGALASFRRSLGIVTALAARDPRPALKRDLAITYDRIAGELEAVKDPRGAIDNYQRGLTLREELAAADPADAQARRDIMLSHIAIGPPLDAVGRMSDAINHYRAGLKLAEDLSAADPTDPLSRRYQAVGAQRIADTLSDHATRGGPESSSRWIEARSFYERAIHALDSARQHGALLPSDKDGEKKLAAGLARCDEALRTLQASRK